MSSSFLRINFTYFILITIVIAASTYFLTSSYALNLSIDALISRYIEETAGIILITKPLDEETFQRLKEIEGVESVHNISRIPISMPWEVAEAIHEVIGMRRQPPPEGPASLGTYLISLNFTDFPLMALPHLVRGRYPERVGECIIDEILFRALERLYGFKLGDAVKVNVTVPLSETEATLMEFSYNVIGAYGAWPAVIGRVTGSIIMDINTFEEVAKRKLSVPSFYPPEFHPIGSNAIVKVPSEPGKVAMRIISELKMRPETVIPMGVISEYVVRVYKDFKNLSNMVLISTVIISIIGISAAKAFEMLKSSWHYGLLIAIGWSWKRISSYELLRSLLSSTLSVIIGIVLALSYGPLLAQLIIRPRTALFELGAFEVERILGAALLALPIAIMPIIIGIVLMIKWRGKTIADLLRSRG